tara:strand:- start:1131 stop:1532 length:402 start_codon:yes stop_codon:yes gene_type:complete
MLAEKVLAISSGKTVACIVADPSFAIFNSYPKAMAKAVAVPATSVLSAIFKEAATPVTAAPDPAPSQNTMSVVPFGIDTVDPVPCFMVAALLPVKEFLIIKNLVAVLGAIVTTLVPPKSEPLSLRFITANMPV